ncbi:hypothetical protein HMPREF9444_01427 [Succinatimonas hippei YIT 12066]|uniref:Uncharacterized protein n=1 Tax=Succinatimonas hippei (strain DSM 22608 / JCM 16073 / KCTC 15190 / YIT 12066) TaxID=762983 RepID=E8LL21_SUCHY|nr:hypothetical protein HMPREF9444_01427 [Succinatimonas hippei YIT 12066]
MRMGTPRFLLKPQEFNNLPKDKSFKAPQKELLEKEEILFIIYQPVVNCMFFKQIYYTVNFRLL